MDAPHVYMRAWALGCLGARLLPQSYQYSNLSDGADRVGGQLRRDKECPFSGVTKSGRVWRKVPESGALSVTMDMSMPVFLWLLIFFFHVQVDTGISQYGMNKVFCNLGYFKNTRPDH